MDCLFCKMVSGEIPCKKIYEDDKVIVILDLYPDADGHSLIIPKKHFDDMMKIDDETLLHVNKVMKMITPVLMDKMNAKAFSSRVNYGDTQAIKHFHMHLLPNFHVKPCSVSQDKAYEMLKDSF